MDQTSRKAMVAANANNLGAIQEMQRAQERGAENGWACFRGAAQKAGEQAPVGAPKRRLSHKPSGAHPPKTCCLVALLPPTSPITTAQPPNRLTTTQATPIHHGTQTKERRHRRAPSLDRAFHPHPRPGMHSSLVASSAVLRRDGFTLSPSRHQHEHKPARIIGRALSCRASAAHCRGRLTYATQTWRSQRERCPCCVPRRARTRLFARPCPRACRMRCASIHNPTMPS
jgi:hypothetical protein